PWGACIGKPPEPMLLYPATLPKVSPYVVRSAPDRRGKDLNTGVLFRNGSFAETLPFSNQANTLCDAAAALFERSLLRCDSATDPATCRGGRGDCQACE